MISAHMLITVLVLLPYFYHIQPSMFLYIYLVERDYGSCIQNNMCYFVDSCEK